MLCSEMETERSEAMDSQPCFAFGNIEPLDMSASDELVKVESGLVLLDPNELSDCLCFVLVWL